MITNLQLKNFKSHKDTNLRLAPLTLITGVNNCGKSSILHAMLALRQTYQAGRLEDGLASAGCALPNYPVSIHQCPNGHERVQQRSQNALPESPL